MINIRLLIMLVITLAAAAIAAVVFAYDIGRWQGSAAERKACEAEIHAAELTAERQARESERKAQEAQNAIVEDYERQVAVGAECDELAIRYRTLVEVCDVKGDDNKPGD